METLTPPINVAGIPYWCDWVDRIFPYGVGVYYAFSRRRIDALYDKWCFKNVGKTATQSYEEI